MTESRYDPVGNVTSIKDIRGKTTTITVNELNQIVQPPVTLHNNSTTTYRTGMGYDANDNIAVVKVENRDEDGVLKAHHPWVHAQYTYTVQAVHPETGVLGAAAAARPERRTRREVAGADQGGAGEG